LRHLQPRAAAHAAGAVGALFIYPTDSVPKVLGSVPNGATDRLTTFTSNIIGLTDGATILAQLNASTPVNVTLFRGPAKRDGSVDGFIVSHEWGHSLSNRLIGNASGIDNQQGGGMGEGWSDFVALLTYIRETDLQVPSNANWQGVYAVGSYADGGFPEDLYYGIRRYPYSNDIAKDPLTFKHISTGQALPTTPPPLFADPGTNAEVHNVGEIWASMLWIATWPPAGHRQLQLRHRRSGDARLPGGLAQADPKLADLPRGA